MALSSSPAPHGELEVFFDGHCPICQREIAFLRRRDREGRIRFTDIAAADFRPAGLGLSQGQLMAEIHARLPDGRIIRGVEVFRRLYEAVGWRRLVAWSRWAPAAWLLEGMYRVFARNRLRLTGRCGPACARKRTGPSDDAHLSEAVR